MSVIASSPSTSLPVSGSKKASPHAPASAHNVVARSPDARVSSVTRPVSGQRPVQKGNHLVSGITVEPNEDEVVQHDRLISGHLEHGPSGAIRAHIILHGGK